MPAKRAATTKTLVPAMKERGYRADFAAALTAASCVIGPVIPPSIVMLFYAALMNVPEAALFASGIVPGLLMAAFLGVYNFWVARREGHPGGKGERLPPALPTLLRALPALLIPVTIVAGIIFGVVTPTEAAALAMTLSREGEEAARLTEVSATTSFLGTQMARMTARTFCFPQQR